MKLLKFKISKGHSSLWGQDKILSVYQERPYWITFVTLVNFLYAKCDLWYLGTENQCFQLKEQIHLSEMDIHWSIKLEWPFTQH